MLPTAAPPTDVGGAAAAGIGAGGRIKPTLVATFIPVPSVIRARTRDNRCRQPFCQCDKQLRDQQLRGEN
jgi:hypothetical protein